MFYEIASKFINQILADSMYLCFESSTQKAFHVNKFSLTKLVDSKIQIEISNSLLMSMHADIVQILNLRQKVDDS